MNPLKKTLLGILFGFAIGLVAYSSTGRTEIVECFLFSLYAIGIIFGWRIILPLVGKALHIGTDLTFWILFIILFRRGILWGVITFLVIVVFAAGIGCWAGGLICLWECGKYIIGRRDDWKRASVFPCSEANAYSLILVWFAKYNQQTDLNDSDFEPILSRFPKQTPNFERIVDSMQKDELPDLSMALDIFRRQVQSPKTGLVSFLLLHAIMQLIARSNRLTFQAREFILLLLDCHTITWEGFAEEYQRLYGRPLPVVNDEYAASACRA